MKVLNLASADYANYSHENANALRSIGVDCVDLVRSPHPFKYGSESKLAKVSEMVTEIKDVDVIQVMHSDPFLFELSKNNNPNAKTIVYHTGTRYREGHKELDVLFKDTPAFTDQTEFFAFNPNLHYVVSPVEFEMGQLYDEGKLKVGHYPSNPEVKGTSKIVEMISEIKDQIDWRFSIKKVDHYLQLERMAKCDVYLELFKPEINGNPYGCFGVTALEAAAMGKIVITNNLYPKVYTDAYGKCPMTFANNEYQFKNVLNGLLKMDRNMIRMVQKETFYIMRENHSYEATGKRILKVINEA